MPKLWHIEAPSGENLGQWPGSTPAVALVACFRSMNCTDAEVSVSDSRREVVFAPGSAPEFGPEDLWKFSIAHAEIVDG